MRRWVMRCCWRAASWSSSARELCETGFEDMQELRGGAAAGEDDVAEAELLFVERIEFYEAGGYGGEGLLGGGLARAVEWLRNPLMSR